jgi:predicted RNase H-like nuclease (RuvC/YqgF family)
MLYRSEERVKRLLDENEHLKSQIRAKDRDITLLSDKVRKIAGEIENEEKETRNLTKEATERDLKLESLEKQRLDL